MFRIAVCDDDSIEIEKVREYTQIYSIRHDLNIIMQGFLSGEALLKDYRKGDYELILMDVEMPGMDGIETAEKIRHLPDHEVDIIYASNYPQYMQESFRVRAAQYLTKPVSYEIFERKIDEMLAYHREEKEKMIELSDGSEHYILRQDNLIKIETFRGVLVFTTNQETIRMRGRLKDYLIYAESFMVVPNQSTLVNIEYVHRISDGFLYLTNGDRIIISRRRRQNLKEEISRLIRDKW